MGSFSPYDFADDIINFVKTYEKPEDITIDAVRQFYEDSVKEPDDITEKELYETYFEPFRHVMLRRFRPFTSVAIHFHAYAISRYLYNDFDYVAIVAGTEGKGKSTFELNSAEDLKKLGINYSLEDMIFRGSTEEEVLKIISEYKMGQVCFDEAKPFFDKRQSMNSEQVEIIQEITAQRKNNNIYWMCIGDVDEIDKYFRERRAREVVLIPDRKLFVVLLNMGIVGMGRDRFRLDFLDEYVLRQNRLDYKRQISQVMNLPSAHMVGSFYKVEQELFNKYRAIKEEKNSLARQLQKLKILRRRQKKGSFRFNPLAKFMDGGADG